jgi:hypothetical protein
MYEVIWTEGLTKDYGRGRRRHRGLDGLDLAVRPGEARHGPDLVAA